MPVFSANAENADIIVTTSNGRNQVVTDGTAVCLSAVLMIRPVVKKDGEL